MTFPGLEKAIGKFHGFSGFSMTMGTPVKQPHTQTHYSDNCDTSLKRRSETEIPAQHEAVVAVCLGQKFLLFLVFERVKVT